jgi:hypothetical protein
MIWVARIFLALLVSLAAPLRAEEVQLPEKEMLSLINKASGGIELYTTPDIPVENRNQFDLNEDGVAEWFIVPKTACGDTKNCQFFVIRPGESSSRPTAN